MTGVIFWNCRGARKLTSRHHLQKLVATYNPIAVFLFETRISVFGRADADRLINKSWEFAIQPSVGKSGGIIMLWNPTYLSFEVLLLDRQFILAKAHPSIGVPWIVAGVYANKDYHSRRYIWEKLSEFGSSDAPFMVGGDFNCILNENEKRGGKPFRMNHGSTEFADFISSCGLQDVSPTAGTTFTWCNNKIGGARILERLDRVLLNDSGLSVFSGSTVEHLVRVASDHSPVLLTLSSIDFRPFSRLIKFDDCWTLLEDASLIVTSAWGRPCKGSPQHLFNHKCSRTLRSLFSWSKEKIRGLDKQVQESELQIAELQQLDATVGLADDGISSLRALVSKHSSLLGMVELRWWQRAKAKWLSCGDRNTSFFHSAATARKRKNHIFSISDCNGSICTDRPGMECALSDHFSSRWCPPLSDLDFTKLQQPTNVLSDLDAQSLMVPVSVEEIHNTIRSFKCNRSPGIDGITATFFKSYWHICGEDLTGAVQNFFSSGIMCQRWKDTVVTLIPKVDCPTKASDYRPISLCNTIYKVVTKILTRRLSQIMPKLISGVQAGFVAGRSLSENCLLANEVVHRMHTSESASGFMAIQIDMEQAFDSIRWEFVEYVLVKFHFPATWITWILACISQPRFSILLNGSKCPWLRATCGLRQGCPLSPYLYILCAQMLTTLADSRVASHELMGIKVANTAPTITHLLFADDILFFTPATKEAGSQVLSVMNDYCCASGQRVNQSKCNILFSKRSTAANKLSILRRLHFREVDVLKYLGTALHHGRPTPNDFRRLISCTQQRIGSWGTRFLSMAGRACLINSSLIPLVGFHMTNSLIPQSVIDKLESLYKNFLWGGKATRNGIHYLPWEVVCQPKSCGGLGIRKLNLWQQALVAKITFGFIARRNSLFIQVFLSKYCKHGDAINFINRRGESWAWKLLCLGGPLANSNSRWMVGSGSSISTFKDCWVGHSSFSRWPTFVSTELTFFPQVGGLLDDNGSWNDVTLHCFLGPDLIQLIHDSFRRCLGGPDFLHWTCSDEVKCSAGSLYDSCFQSVEQVSPHFGWIWRLALQPRVAFFLWRVLHNAIPTNVWLLHHRLRPDSLCSWGCCLAEDIEHVFFNCTFAYSAITHLCAILGCCMPSSFQDLLMVIKSACYRVSASWAQLLYLIWKGRNCQNAGKPAISPSAAALSAYKCFLPSDRDHWRSSHLDGVCSPHNSWIPPPPGWAKLNFDGARSSSAGGIGFIVRDSNGMCLFADGCRSPPWAVNTIELHAALHGLSQLVLIEEGLLGVILEGDCLRTILSISRILNGDYGDNYEDNYGLQQIKAILPRFKHVKICHVLCIANRAANCIAQHALSFDCNWGWGMPHPPGLAHIVQSDWDVF